MTGRRHFSLSRRRTSNTSDSPSALVAGDTPSTRAATTALASISENRNLLIVAERGDEVTWLSLRNHLAVHLIEPGQLNTYDVVVSDDVVFTAAALDAFIAGRTNGIVGRGVASSAELSADETVAAEADAPAEKPKKKAAKKAAVLDDAAPADAEDEN